MKIEKQIFTNFSYFYGFVFLDFFSITTFAENEAQFRSTNRGGRKLIHNGYAFTVNRKMNSSVISWKCCRYKIYGCYARAVTKVIDGREYVKLSKPNHTHPPETNITNHNFKFESDNSLK